MTTSSPSRTSLLHNVIASLRPRSSSNSAMLRCQSPTDPGFFGFSKHVRKINSLWVDRAKGAGHWRWSASCAADLAAGQSNDPENVKMSHAIDRVKKMWDSSPQSVKKFPWGRAVDNFIQLILDITLSVVKFLAFPLLMVSSLSEMSYCAHEKKLFLVPFPMLIGIAVAGIFKETALELSPRLKDAEVPWHLITIALFFTLLKFPGPYYPYLGRIIIPHIANGALLRTLWFAFSWHREAKSAPRTINS